MPNFYIKHPRKWGLFQFPNDNTKKTSKKTFNVNDNFTTNTTLITKWKTKTIINITNAINIFNITKSTKPKLADKPKPEKPELAEKPEQDNKDTISELAEGNLDYLVGFMDYMEAEDIETYFGSFIDWLSAIFPQPESDWLQPSWSHISNLF